MPTRFLGYNGIAQRLREEFRRFPPGWLRLHSQTAATMSDTSEEMVQASNYYQLLGISPSAKRADIRRAYRKAALRYHPDVCRHEDQASIERFRDVVHAYRVLINPSSRSRYDRERGTVRGIPPSDLLAARRYYDLTWEPTPAPGNARSSHPRVERLSKLAVIAYILSLGSILGFFPIGLLLAAIGAMLALVVVRRGRGGFASATTMSVAWAAQVCSAMGVVFSLTWSVLARAAGV